MASEQDEAMLDSAQVKKAVLALLAFLKTTSTSESLLLCESQHISLLFTLWRIPKKEQTIRIPLPNGIRTDTSEVCLFTKDEPNMTPDQTERFYKKLLTVKGVKRITEVMPLKRLKTEYKPFEAKRRLLGNFDLFLADSRVYRLLPSHIGKHFYASKKAPLSVDLQSKQLARDMERLITGSTLHVNKKGSCCMARVAHSGMTADQVVENIMVAVSTIASKLPLKGKSIKIIHLKSQTSVALPIYTSDLKNMPLVEEGSSKTNSSKKLKDKRKARKRQKQTGKNVPPDGDQHISDEEIPQLVPIASPSKKAKSETVSAEGLEKAPKPSGVKRHKKGNSPRSYQTDTSCCSLSDRLATGNTRFRMLSAGITGSLTEKTAGVGVKDSSRRSLFPEGETHVVDPPPWTHYHKPIIVLVLGGLMLGTGSVLSLLQYNQVVSLSYTMGTVCMSIGLMFLVTGLVWVPVIKQKLHRKHLAQKEYVRFSGG
ncbi:hypothetical protein GJAV_G00262940 [Gymnothorax javanicus]|nr:hypothetical protein GJAV_G00262940 [Gymnothorax javanicus]